MKKIVYIAHPIGGDVKNNLDDLCRIMRIIDLNIHPNRFELQGGQYPYEFLNIIPTAPYYANCVYLNDDNINERTKGIDNDIAMIQTGMFKELWLTGEKISNGMQVEMCIFQSFGWPIRNYIRKI